MNIYIGNINYKLREDDVEQLFSDYGHVSSVKILRDKRTGKSKGYGFVEMENKESALRAVEELHRYEVSNRKLVVCIAKQSVEEGVLEYSDELAVN